MDRVRRGSTDWGSVFSGHPSWRVPHPRAESLLWRTAVWNPPTGDSEWRTRNPGRREGVSGTAVGQRLLSSWEGIEVWRNQGKNNGQVCPRLRSIFIHKVHETNIYIFHKVDQNNFLFKGLLKHTICLSTKKTPASAMLTEWTLTNWTRRSHFKG